MRNSIDGLTKKHDRIVITGDFNLLHIDAYGKLHDLDCILANKINLNHIATSPIQEGALLGLIYTSPHFASSNVTKLPPRAGFDHNDEPCSLRGQLSVGRDKSYLKTD